MFDDSKLSNFSDSLPSLGALEESVKTTKTPPASGLNLSTKFDIKRQPMFFGESLGLTRFDQMRYPIFEKLTVSQNENYWQAHDVNLSQDRIDFDTRLLPNQKFIVVKNLGYQVLMDSVQSRLTIEAFRPWVSLPELDGCIQTWAYFESIHNKAYQHIVNNLYTNPSDFYDTILEDPNIVERARVIMRYYDEFINYGDQVKVFGYNKTLGLTLYEHKRLAYRAMVSVYALESIRFYVSFACAFSLAQQGLMIGNGKQMRLIARDEALHVGISLNILRLWPKEDADFAKIAASEMPFVIELFKEVVDGEKYWASNTVFSKGDMLGMNAQLMGNYIEHLANKRLKAIGCEQVFANKINPFTWMNSWLSSDDTQVAPQETEITDYKVSALNTQVDASKLVLDF
jgi:ribonucleoside-diphosphate reductase beta chain